MKKKMKSKILFYKEYSSEDILKNPLFNATSTEESKSLPRTS